MKTLAIAATLTLSLIASPWAFVHSSDEKLKTGEQSQDHHKTIQGVVAGVTVVGETMVDYLQKRAVTAESDYLTIVVPSTEGDQREQQSKKGDHGAGEQASGSAKQDRDVKQTSNAGQESQHPEESSRQSARVFLIQVTPKTQVCECDEGGKKQCDLTHLEIGDRVEVEYEPSDASAAQSQDTRHGRHRLMRGQAASITILHDKADGHQSSEKAG